MDTCGREEHGKQLRMHLVNRCWSKLGCITCHSANLRVRVSDSLWIKTDACFSQDLMKPHSLAFQSVQPAQVCKWHLLALPSSGPLSPLWLGWSLNQQSLLSTWVTGDNPLGYLHAWNLSWIQMRWHYPMDCGSWTQGLNRRGEYSFLSAFWLHILTPSCLQCFPIMRTALSDPEPRKTFPSVSCLF